MRKQPKAIGEPEDKSAFVLSDGRKITFDLSKITRRQFIGLFDKNSAPEDDDKAIARVAGLSYDQLLDLNEIDYKRLVARFFKTMREPLADPNA